MFNRFQNANKGVVIISRPFFILLLLSVLLYAKPAKATFTFTPAIEDAYHDILKLKIAGGKNKIKILQELHPNNGIPIYIENYADILQVFISESPSLYNSLKNNEELRLNKIRKLPSDSPYYLYTQAEIKLQWAIIKLKFGDELSAVWNIRQAFRLLEDNHKKYPKFLPNQKNLGILHILIGSIPEKYTWLVGLVGMHGDINKGQKMLDEVIKNDHVYYLEANIYKIFANYYILNHPNNNFQDIKRLCQAHPDNLLLSFLSASTMMKESYNEAALKILQNIPSDSSYIQFPFLDHMLGVIYLNKGLYNDSRTYLFKYLKANKGTNYIKDTYYRIFLTYWLNNEDEKAFPYLLKVNQYGTSLYDSDKYAEEFAKKRDFPHKSLMKARLYTDGGYYDNAHASLKNIHIVSLNQKDLTEYYYRLARVYHKTDNIAQAIEKYMKTMEESGTLPYYFAPNSALQLGYIYRDQKNNEEARIWFQKALSYKNHEYKNSIDNKAKAALNEIKK